MIEIILIVLISNCLGYLAADGFQRKKPSIWITSILAMLAFMGYFVLVELDKMK